MRYYVSMTWDDWPEGGTYTTLVDAESDEEALAKVKRQMAEARIFDDEEYDEEYTRDMAIDECLEGYGDAWHEVECLPIDDFIEHLQQIKEDSYG